MIWQNILYILALAILIKLSKKKIVRKSKIINTYNNTTIRSNLVSVAYKYTILKSIFLDEQRKRQKKIIKKRTFQFRLYNKVLIEY